MSSSFAELGSFVEVSNYIELSNFAHLDPWVAAVVLTVMAVANLDSTRTGTVTRWGVDSSGDATLYEVPEGLAGIEGAFLAETVEDGATLGEELIKDPGFDDPDSAWTSTVWAWGDGTASISDSDGINYITYYLGVSLTAGERAVLTVDIAEVSGGNLRTVFRGSAVTLLSTPGVYEVEFVAGSASDGRLFVGARDGASIVLNSVSVKKVIPQWKGTLPDGTKLTGIKEVVEEEGTNYLLNSDSPATQTTGSLTAGTYTLWVDDDATGSATVSANTATITGAGSATAGNPLTFTVDTAGTVDVTVVDTVTRFQLESGDRRTAFIYTEDTTSTRDAETPTYPTPSVITAESGVIDMTVTLTGDLGTNDYLYTWFFDSANLFGIYSPTTDRVNFVQSVGGVNYRSGPAIFSSDIVAGDVLRVVGYWQQDLTFGVRARLNGGVWMSDFDTMPQAPTITDDIQLCHRNGSRVLDADFKPDDIKFYSTIEQWEKVNV